MAYVSLAPTNVTKGFLVMLDDPSNRLVFQYNPERIEDSRSPNWSSITVPGISHPRHQFVNGGARVVSFRLSFLYPDDDRNGIRKRIKWLQSLTYPQHDGNNLLQASPPIMIFGFGNFYPSLKCIVTNVKVTAFDLFDPTSLNPLRADIDIELEETLGGDPSKSRSAMGGGGIN